MADARQLLADALAQLDAPSSLEHHAVIKALEPAGAAAKEAGETVDALRFEFIAVYLALYDEPNVWGTNYGPEMSSIDKDGNRFDTPPLESITPQCIAYWTARMNAAKHPALRARYGDMVWDLSQKATGNRPPIAAAQIAIDGYAEALTTFPEMSSNNWGDIQKRIVDLALSINDEERLRKAVAANVAYANAKVDKDESEFRQRSLFGILRSIPPRRRPQGEFAKVLEDFRTRLNELDAGQADKFTIGDVALPLAQYYWSSQQPDEAKTVIRIWGTAVERLANETTMPMLSSAWLTELHQVYQRYEMHEEARDLIAKIEAASAGIEKELVRVSHSATIPKDKWDKVVNDLTSGTKDEVLRKLALNFLPRVGEAEQLVTEISSKTIYMNLTQQIIAEDGRVTATIGPVEQDLDGHIVQQLGRTMQFYGQLYRPTWDEAVARLSLTADDIVEWLAKSPLFEEERLKLLTPAIAAYLIGDWSTAIHVAIPQIENALRQVLVKCGQPLIRPHRNGTFLLKNLDEVLRDPVTVRALPEDVRVYLRTLLCDQRGLNVRNNVCHGLWSSEQFNWFVADRVIHAVLLIGLLRANTFASHDAASSTESSAQPSSI